MTGKYKADIIVSSGEGNQGRIEGRHGTAKVYSNSIKGISLRL